MDFECWMNIYHCFSRAYVFNLAYAARRVPTNISVLFINLKSHIGITSVTQSAQPRNGYASNILDKASAYSSAKPRSGDALIAPPRPSKGETKKLTEGKIFCPPVRGRRGVKWHPNQRQRRRRRTKNQSTSPR